MVQFIERHEEDLMSTMNSDDEVEGKHVGMVDALDIGKYMTADAMDIAKRLPSFIKRYLSNCPL
ncbi:hypothetical protein HPP92_028491 [Vanilla planifolia]|uniref:Uncharacterized protein n=1 Tax=Vanilla planifolia TaxID=51239 RepID=A0A835P770_VANPL|nr:hypothetical protein HPP92_028491 [Vanilla planifolia]